MKIIYHHRTRFGDAQGIHIFEMVKAFRDLGHTVEIIGLVNPESRSTNKSSGQFFERLTSCIPSWFYELMSLSYNLYGYWFLKRNILKERPDLIYERYSLNTFCGIWASRHFGIPIVLEVNLPLYYELSRYRKLTFRKLARFSERWICANATWTIVVSKAMKDYFIGEGVPSKKMTVLSNGIDPNLFHCGVSGKEVRDRYHLLDNIVVGFVGWFREWHGLELLLEIMHESDLAKKGVRLILVGDGPAYEKLHNYAGEHGLLSAVIFTGPIERANIPSFIAAMDIAVLPKTNDYGCPMKIVEYMAMGKCIVAPDLPVIRELVKDESSARLFRPDDQGDFKKALLQTINDPRLRAELGAKAHGAVGRRRYFWSVNAERTLELVFDKPKFNNGFAEFSNSSAREILD